MSVTGVLRLARSGVRSLPELEAVLRAVLFAEIPPSELQANLDAVTVAIDAVAKKHGDSGVAIAELLDDFEELPQRGTRAVRWVQDVLRGESSAVDQLELAETIERVREKPELFARPVPAGAAVKSRGAAIDADAILRETGSRAAFDRLVKAHGPDRHVTPFIGAGLSVESGYPGWRQFLVESAKRFHGEVEVEKCLANNEYEEAAQALRNAAEAAQYRSLIETTFGAEHEPKGAVCVLPDITTSLVITLNYDRLIEEVYARKGVLLTRVIASLADTFRGALHDDPSPALLKVHGDVFEGTHRILTADEYRTAYEAQTAQLPDLLLAACIKRRLLFLGCSFTDKRLLAVLEKAKRSTPGHFAIMAADGNEELRRLLSSLSIEVIYYRDRQYGDVRVLLEAFVRAARSAFRVTKRVKNALRKVADTIGRSLDDIRKFAEAVRRAGASAAVQSAEAASADRSIGVLVQTAHQELLHCREVVVKDGAPATLLALIDAADQSMLMLSSSRDRERLDTAARATKELRGAINAILHPS